MILCLLFGFSIQGKNQSIENELASLEPLLKNTEIGSVIVVEGNDKYRELNISKKGIITADYIEEGKWQLTALKKGEVFVRLGPKYWRIIVSEGVKNHIPLWICGVKGVTCHHESQSISGTLNSFTLFQKISMQCIPKKGCLNDLLLGPNGQEQMATQIRKIVPELLFSVNQWGQINVDSCDPPLRLKEIRERLVVFVSEKKVFLNCSQKSVKSNFKVEVKAVHLQSHKQKTLGIDQYFLSIEFAKGLFSKKMTVEARDSKDRLSLVGNPIFAVSLNHPTEVISGGELKETVIGSGGREQTVQWKNYGLHIKTEVRPQINEKYFMDFEFNLTRPQNGGGSLSKNRVKSKVQVQLSDPILVGSLNLNSEDWSYVSNPVLEKIPIIGPLFQYNNESESSHSLLLWLTLEENTKISEG